MPKYGVGNEHRCKKKTKFFWAKRSQICERRQVKFVSLIRLSTRTSWHLLWPPTRWETVCINPPSSHTTPKHQNSKPTGPLSVSASSFSFYFLEFWCEAGFLGRESVSHGLLAHVLNWPQQLGGNQWPADYPSDGWVATNACFFSLGRKMCVSLPVPYRNYLVFLMGEECPKYLDSAV